MSIRVPCTPPRETPPSVETKPAGSSIRKNFWLLIANSLAVPLALAGHQRMPGLGHTQRKRYFFPFASPASPASRLSVSGTRRSAKPAMKAQTSSFATSATRSGL